MMNQTIKNDQINGAENLNLLLSNLEESIFFARLSVILKQAFPEEQNEIYFLRSDESFVLTALNGEAKSDIAFNKGDSICSYVHKIKRPYFSNAIKRDPLFSTMNNKRTIASHLDHELVYPITANNTVIATIHLRSENIVYSEKDITRLKLSLLPYQNAFENLSNYLMVKYVNNELINKFEQNISEKSQKSEKEIIKADEIIGFDKKMQLVRQTTEKAAQGDFPVLIEGGLGVGKRFIAKKIHQMSIRSVNQLVVFECGVKDEDSLEKELFGFMDRVGMLEHANNGTIILSDIHELPLTTQSKLLQYITSGWFVRINNKERVNLNVRIIATSRVALSELVAQKKFREDLYYRLNTLSIRVPALDDRKDDIKLLADHFLNIGRTAKKYISGSVLKKLEEHKWGANILELKGIMERAYMLIDSECVDSIEFNVNTPVAPVKTEQLAAKPIDNNEEEITLFELEKKFIFKTLVKLGGNKTKAAKALGITVKTLYNKLHSYGIEFEEKVTSLN